MHEYKVFKWLFGANTADDLEDELNNYAKEGWKISNIVPTVKGNLGAAEEETTTIIMERKVN